MKFLLIILIAAAAPAVFAETYSCQVLNQMEMINFVKKHDLETSGALYILELHTIGEPFAHTASEGVGNLAGSDLSYQSNDFNLSAILSIEKMAGSFQYDGKETQFLDCQYQP